MYKFLITAIMAIVFFMGASSVEAQTDQISSITQEILSENGITEEQATRLSVNTPLSFRGEIYRLAPGESPWTIAEQIVLDEAIRAVIDPYETQIAQLNVELAEVNQALSEANTTITNYDERLTAVNASIASLSTLVQEQQGSTPLLYWIAIAVLAIALISVIIWIFWERALHRATWHKYLHMRQRRALSVQKRKAAEDMILELRSSRKDLRVEKAELKLNLEEALRHRNELTERTFAAETRANSAERDLSYETADKEAAENALRGARTALKNMAQTMERNPICWIPLSITFAGHIVPEARHLEQRTFTTYIGRDNGTIRIMLPNGATFAYNKATLRRGILTPDCINIIHGVTGMNIALPSQFGPDDRVNAFENLPGPKEVEEYYNTMVRTSGTVLQHA